MVHPSSALPVCIGCGVPVFELDGQLVMLDSYLIHERFPSGAGAGAWHTDCLERSSCGRDWHVALARSYLSVRGYTKRVETEGFLVVENPRTREVLALDRRGPVQQLRFDPGASQVVEGGAAFLTTTREYGLHVEASLAHALATDLRARRTLPLLTVADRLVPSPRVVRPELANDACFVFDEALAEEWMPGFVLAQVVYRVFVPSELIAYTTVAARAQRS